MFIPEKLLQRKRNFTYLVDCRSIMGRNLSPVLRRELANLDKDADSRKSAMKSLKSYVKDLDSKAIPLFLAQVSETKETVLARVHGVNIFPQIDSIMATVIKTLTSSAGSFPLQQACSKVVPAIARYGIDPTTLEDKKRHIIHSLCKPLLGVLLDSQGCLTSGAALCLKALVDSDNWRFASDEMVNRVCQNVAVVSPVEFTCSVVLCFSSTLHLIMLCIVIDSANDHTAKDQQILGLCFLCVPIVD
ncbi:hypothetical protein K2173_016497 [Erythroxylum novogranatense]|uniref:Uncharacterized protein n=1 Tax=Erythroxylum novogranatense TaxID=1862640 RepID=A0AAV8ST57_9ROSI|nr:hypothetical protein K2173_016497 [Erythroxylum novogranatense]